MQARVIPFRPTPYPSGSSPDETAIMRYREECLLAEDELESETAAALERYQYRRNEAAKILNQRGEN